MTATVNGYRPADIPAELAAVDLEALEAEDREQATAPVEAPTRRPNPLATVAADLRGSWAVVAEPPSLHDWVAGPTTSLVRVPDGNQVLRFAWSFDNWFTGVLFLATSIALFGVAATFRWLACHPARRWSALALTCAVVTYLLVA